MKKLLVQKKLAILLIISLFIFIFYLAYKQNVLRHIHVSNYILKNESNVEKFKANLNSNENALNIPLVISNDEVLSLACNISLKNDISSPITIGLYNNDLKKFEYKEEFKIKNNETIISNIKCPSCNNNNVSLKINPENNDIKISNISLLHTKSMPFKIRIFCYLLISLFYTTLLVALGIFFSSIKKEIFSFKKIGGFIFVIASVLLVFFYLYRNFCIDIFNTPFSFLSHDDGQYLSIAKNAVSQNSFWFMNDMGMPFGVTRYGFPMMMAFYYGFCRFLGFFTNNAIFVNNFYYICTFIFITFSFILVARFLKINFLFSVLGGITYAFSVYHLFRAIKHITASTYLSVPLILYWCLQIVLSDNFNKKELERKSKLKLYSAIIITSFLIGSTDIFYAYFGCCFLAISLIIAILDGRKVAFKRGSLIIFLITISLVSNLYAPIINIILNGSSKTVTRSPYEAFVYGLQLVHLFMPLKAGDSHILGWLAPKYLNSNFLKNESTFSYLGIFGCLGFLTLLAFLFFGSLEKYLKNYESNQNKGLLKLLGKFNIFAFLFGSSAGIGVIIALCGFSTVRTYNRISIYILLFSLITFFYLLDLLLKKHLKSKKLFNTVISICFISFVCIHVNETNLKKQIPNFNKTKNLSSAIEEFSKNVEKFYGRKANILQLPIIPYPENRINEKIANWTLPAYSYAFTNNLKISYGTLGHTDELLWQKQFFDINDAKQIVINAIENNFDGIFIYKDIFLENKNIINDFKAVLGNPIFKSKKKNIYFFDLTNYKKEIKKNNALNNNFFNENINLIKNDNFIENGFEELTKDSQFNGRWGMIEDKKNKKNANSIIKYVVTPNIPYTIKFNVYSPIKNKISIFLGEHFIGEFNIKIGENSFETNLIYEKSSDNFNKINALKLKHESFFIPKILIKNSNDPRRLTTYYKDIHISYKK